MPGLLLAEVVFARGACALAFHSFTLNPLLQFTPSSFVNITWHLCHPFCLSIGYHFNHSLILLACRLPKAWDGVSGLPEQCGPQAGVQ